MFEELVAQPNIITILSCGYIFADVIYYRGGP